MADFTFVTTNEHKVRVAKITCAEFGVTFKHQNLELTEIQADDGESIARHKAEQAFEICRSPVVVGDSSWFIAGLNGWPGPYMKPANQHLSTQDFLNLTRPLADRQIIYRAILVYKDDGDEKVFAVDIKGVLLKEPRGESKYPSFPIISLDGGRRSLAEADLTDQPGAADQRNTWHELCEWLKSR